MPFEGCLCVALIAKEADGRFNGSVVPVQDAPSRYTFDRVVRMTLSAATAVAVIALLRYLSDVLIPFAAAIVLAYLLNPTVGALQRRVRHRGAAVGLTLVGLGVLGAAAVGLLVPLVLSQVDRFYRDVQKLREEFEFSALDARSAVASSATSSGAKGSLTGDGAATDVPPTKSAIGWRELIDGWNEYRATAASRPRSERIRGLMDRVSGTWVGSALRAGADYSKTDEFKQTLVDVGKQLAAGGWTVVTFLANSVLALAGLMIVLAYVVFLLLDFPEYERTWSSFLPPSYREAIVEFLTQFNLAMRRYLRGQAVVALLTGTLVAIGLTIIGLPMAVPMGLFVGALTMVPYLPIVAIVPATFLAGIRTIEHESSFLMSIGLVILVFVIVQLLQDWVIAPRVVGKATGLRPVAILLGIFVWGKLLGFLGLILAIPLTCLGIAYYRRNVLMVGKELRMANGE